MNNILSKLSCAFFILINAIGFINIINNSVLSNPLHISIQITLMILAVTTLTNTMINFYESKDHYTIRIGSFIIQTHIVFQFIEALSLNKLNKLSIYLINAPSILSIFR